MCFLGMLKPTHTYTHAKLHLGNECAKVIVQSGIREVVYLYDWDHDKDPYRASRILLTLGGVTTRQYAPQAKHVLLHLVPEDETLASTDQHDCNSQPQQTLNDADARALVWKEARWNGPCTKRRSYLSWDDYFMAMAFLTAKRSKDPNTQVGACIVSPNKKILALGYNGFPRKCSDDHLPWARTGESKLHTKYPYVCHAEVNAILNKCSSNVEGGTLYVALFPCNECAKLIIQAGISEVVYLLDIYHDDDSCRASRILLTMAGVKLRHYVPTVKQILLELNTTDKEEKRSSDLN
jgi:dCMP deaminase